MKKIEAIIREEKLEPVKRALEENSYFGILNLRCKVILVHLI